MRLVIGSINPRLVAWQEAAKGTFQIDPAYDILHVRIPPRSGNKAKCNWKNMAIVFRDGSIDNCDWRISNKLHSTHSESRATEPHSEPAMRLCRWINRGIRTRKRTRRSMRKAQEYTKCIRWRYHRAWALTNSHLIFPEPITSGKSCSISKIL